jgi:hypothetical protein
VVLLELACWATAVEDQEIISYRGYQKSERTANLQLVDEQTGKERWGNVFVQYISKQRVAI